MGSFLSRSRERIGQILAAYRTTSANDPRLLPILVVTALVTFALVVLIGALTGQLWVGVVLGIFLAAAVTMSVFGRRASRAALTQIEGRPGAAAAVLQSMRQPWRVQPAVAFNGKQDMVHRAVGRPGIVLVGEGRGSRVTALLKQERRKIQRVSGDVPVHEIRIGDGEGDVELQKLRLHLMRMPRGLKKGQIGEVERRLAAVGARDMPIPKGPMPNPRRRPRPR